MHHCAGTVLRIRNKGAPILGAKDGARGDHYVTIKVTAASNDSAFISIIYSL
jgi:DnaJ-class molecular chaperone